MISPYSAVRAHPQRNISQGHMTISTVNFPKIARMTYACASLFSGNTYRLDVMDVPGNLQPGRRMSTTCSKINRPVRIEASPPARLIKPNVFMLFCAAPRQSFSLSSYYFSFILASGNPAVTRPCHVELAGKPMFNNVKSSFSHLFSGPLFFVNTEISTAGKYKEKRTQLIRK